MIKRALFNACAILLVLWIGQVQAGDRQLESKGMFHERLDAQQLLYACNASMMTTSGREKRRYCAGFISGVEEALRMYPPAFGRLAHSRVCMPANTTTRELLRLYTRYAMRHSSELHKPAVWTTLRALQWAYPCPNNVSH